MLGDLSLTPFILLAQVAAWVWIVRRARLAAGISDEVERDAVALACLMLIWAAGLSSAALAGLLRLPAVSGLSPVLWLGLVPYALVGLSLLVLPTLRIQSLRLLDRTPAWFLPLLQALRLSALASLVPLYAKLGGAGLWRAMTTEPLPFALAGLDLLYGLSAVVVAFLVAKGRMGPRAQVAWLVLGALLLLVPRLGPMDQSLGLAFSYFYLPLDPQGLLGYPHVLNYGLIGPGFVLVALWHGLWLTRRELARRTLPLGAEPQASAGARRGLQAGLAKMAEPLQALQQRRRRQAAMKAERASERQQAKRRAQEEQAQAKAKAQAKADKRAQKAAAKKNATPAQSEAPLLAQEGEALASPFPSQPPSLPSAADQPLVSDSLASDSLASGSLDAEPAALVASQVPPLAPQDVSGEHNPKAGKRRPWFLGLGKGQHEAKTAKPNAKRGARQTSEPQGAIANESNTAQTGQASADLGQAKNPFGAPPPPLPGHEDLDFDTSPFQIEPLPERAWSKAHDLNAEPDIPFADPLMPTNVAPLPSEVPPPAPPPLDPIFQAVTTTGSPSSEPASDGEQTEGHPDHRTRDSDR